MGGKANGAQEIKIKVPGITLVHLSYLLMMLPNFYLFLFSRKR